mgnify:CR=1 FL=1
MRSSTVSASTYVQWKALTIAALKLDFRLSAVGRSQFRRNVGTIAGLIGQFIFYTFVGAFLAFLAWFSDSLFLVGTIAVSYTMFIVGTAVLLDHNSALASPVDYRCSDSGRLRRARYFAVRLTNVLVLRAGDYQRRGVGCRSTATVRATRSGGRRRHGGRASGKFAGDGVPRCSSPMRGCWKLVGADA